MNIENVNSKVVDYPYGISCRIGDTIYIHKHIKNEPNLYFSLIEHEIHHTSGFKLFDLVYDLKIENIPKKEYWKFVLSHPSSWTEFLPVWRYHKTWVVNVSITLTYIFILSAAWILSKLLLL